MGQERQPSGPESSRGAPADAERVGKLGRSGMAAEGLSGPCCSP